MNNEKIYQQDFDHNRSSLPVVLLGKGALKICSKFTRGHPCRSVISKKLQSNSIEITLRYECSPANLLHIFGTPYLQNISGGLLLSQRTIFYRIMLRSVLRTIWIIYNEAFLRKYLTPKICELFTLINFIITVRKAPKNVSDV